MCQKGEPTSISCTPSQLPAWFSLPLKSEPPPPGDTSSPWHLPCLSPLPPTPFVPWHLLLSNHFPSGILQCLVVAAPLLRQISQAGPSLRGVFLQGLDVWVSTVVELLITSDNTLLQHTNYQLPNGPVKAGRRWGQRHPQGANLGSNGIHNFMSKLKQWLPPAHPKSLASQCMSGQPISTCHALTS